MSVLLDEPREYLDAMFGVIGWRIEQAEELDRLRELEQRGRGT
jgi:hypothetical protein